MKKVKILLFSLIFLFFVTVSFSASGFINVTTPNGGENWQIGSTQNITWNSSGVTGNIIIKLMKGGTMLGSIAYNIPNTGSYSWTINSISGNSIAPGSDYKILVRSFDDHSNEDQSNSNFTIGSTSSGSSITVITPNGGENWQIGTTHNITWNSSGVTGNIIIKLMKSGSMLGSIAYNIANTGSYSWTINDIAGNPIAPGNDYKILVRSFDDHSIEDQSDAVFSIEKKLFESKISLKKLHGKIKILKPNSASFWDEGSSHYIEWKNDFTKSKEVSIQLYNYSGSKLIKTIKTFKPFIMMGNSSDISKYLWKVPDIGPGKFRIKIVRTDETASGMSDKFTVRIKTNKKIYKIYGTTYNKVKWYKSDKDVFTVEQGTGDPGPGKMRVGFENFGDINFIYRSYVLFDINQVKGKGLILSVKLNYNVFMGEPGCITGLSVVDEDWNNPEKMFNCALSPLSNPDKQLIQFVNQWIAYPETNHGILFSGVEGHLKEEYNYSCVALAENVYLEIEVLEKE